MVDMGELAELRGQLRDKLSELQDGFFEDTAAAEAPIVGDLKKRRDLKGHFEKVYSIDWAGRGSDLLISASQDGKLIAWNALSTNKLNAINLKSPWVMSCAFEKKNNQLVASGGLDNVCSIFRLGDHPVGGDNTPMQELEAHLGYISCCRFMDEDKVVTSSGDGNCRVWSVSRGDCLFYFKEHISDVMSVDPHPENTNVFVSGSLDLECKLWDIRTNESVAKFKPKPQERAPRSRYMFGFDEEDMEGTEVGASISYNGHDSDINTVTFFPDGNAFASGSDDSTCRLWDLRCHQEVNMFKKQSILCGISSVKFSNSGRILFGGYDNHMIMGWDTLANPSAEGDEAEPVTSWKKHEQRVSSISVHSDGLALATASWDSFIQIHA